MVLKSKTQRTREQGQLLSGVMCCSQLCKAHGSQTEPCSCTAVNEIRRFHLSATAEQQALGHCFMAMCLLMCWCEARSTVSLSCCRGVNVKLAVQCCYNSHTSIVNVNGVCNMVKIDTFFFSNVL